MRGEVEPVRDHANVTAGLTPALTSPNAWRWGMWSKRKPRPSRLVPLATRVRRGGQRRFGWARLARGRRARRRRFPECCRQQWAMRWTAP